jgi:hypothetical protein
MAERELVQEQEIQFKAVPTRAWAPEGKTENEV